MDVCLIEETHFTVDECKYFNICNFNHFGNARTAHGGGTSILIRSGIAIVPGDCGMVNNM